VSSLLMAHQHS